MEGPAEKDRLKLWERRPSKVSAASEKVEENGIHRKRYTSSTARKRNRSR